MDDSTSSDQPPPRSEPEPPLLAQAQVTRAAQQCTGLAQTNLVVGVPISYSVFPQGANMGTGSVFLSVLGEWCRPGGIVSG